MDSSDDGSQPDDDSVSFRTPQNRVGVRTRHMAFNAEAYPYCSRNRDGDWFGS